MAYAYLGIGTNLGDREQHLRRARAAFDALEGVRVLAWSEAIETAPVGPVAQGPYLNAAAVLETTIEPLDLLDAMREIERLAGRPPESQRVHWGPRELDLDMLMYDDQVLDSERLKLPHPQMHRRSFVLKPLAAIAPDAVHPSTGKTIAQLLTEVESQEKTGHSAP